MCSPSKGALVSKVLCSRFVTARVFSGVTWLLAVNISRTELLTVPLNFATNFNRNMLRISSSIGATPGCLRQQP
jgi:hypothetical protein